MGLKRSTLAGILGKLPVAGGGTIFLQETFTGTPGTALTALTPTTGGAWSVQTGNSPASPDAIDTAGTALYSPTTSGTYQNAATPASANYYVEAVLNMLSLATGDNIGITARADTAANTYYFTRWSTGGNWSLFKNIAGTATQLGSNVADAWTTGSRTVRLTVTGSTITVSVGGSVIITATDGAITAAGKAGIRLAFANGPAAGIHMTSIVAST